MWIIVLTNFKLIKYICLLLKLKNMNIKNFIIGTVAAFLAYFLLGWLFYGTLLKDMYPAEPGVEKSMLFVTLGCLFSGAMMSYIFDKFSGAVSSIQSAGITAGMIGLFGALSMHCYMISSGHGKETNMMLIDLAVNFIMSAVAGIAIWFTVSKFGGKES